MTVVLTAALPFAALALRGPSGSRCALDGRALDPRGVVVVTDTDAQRDTFCSIVCAEVWTRSFADRVADVRVTDETSGALVPASAATFVRSRVPTPVPSADPVHAFADEGAARDHARRHRGVVLDGARRPFVRVGVRLDGQESEAPAARPDPQHH